MVIKVCITRARTSIPLRFSKRPSPFGLPRFFSPPSSSTCSPQLGNTRKITGAELGDEVGLHPRGISDFFDALVAMKFLDREGDGPEAKYSNTPAGALYLDRGSPRYVGGWLVSYVQ